MMLSQEELDLAFPPDLITVTENRFCVRWYRSIKDPTKEIVIVYDKNIRKVVYRGKSNDRHDHYKHIQHHYGKSECDPPKEVHPRAYEGL